jgi:hypothetical protein
MGRFQRGGNEKNIPDHGDEVSVPVSMRAGGTLTHVMMGILTFTHVKLHL